MRSVPMLHCANPMRDGTQMCIRDRSMTADWEEMLLMIERGEYDSNAFLKEIQDMISALVQTYEKVKGSDVLMAKEVQTDVYKRQGRYPVCECP